MVPYGKNYIQTASAGAALLGGGCVFFRVRSCAMLEISPNEADIGPVTIGKTYTHEIDITNPLSCAVEFDIRPVNTLKASAQLSPTLL